MGNVGKFLARFSTTIFAKTLPGSRIRRYLKSPPQEENGEKQPNRGAANIVATTPAYDRDNTCWWCKQHGYDRFNCKRPPKKFCSQCGVLTKDCHLRPGNASAAGGTEHTPAADRACIEYTSRPHFTAYRRLPGQRTFRHGIQDINYQLRDRENGENAADLTDREGGTGAFSRWYTRDNTERS
ncbi:hypothetical protein P5V15_002529 [Pogonomyrmex californicus]